VYDADPRVDYAIPLTANNTIDVRFSAWLQQDSKRLASYQTTID
jgi:hypothetical protein